MKIVKCNKCGSVVDKENVSEGYSYHCPNCDEDLYEFETTKSDRKIQVRVKTAFSRIVEIDEKDPQKACDIAKGMLEDGTIALGEEKGDLDYNDVQYYGFADKDEIPTYIAKCTAHSGVYCDHCVGNENECTYSSFCPFKRVVKEGT